MTDEELKNYIASMDKYERRTLVMKLLRAQEYQKLQRYSQIWADVERGRTTLFGDES